MLHSRIPFYNRKKLSRFQRRRGLARSVEGPRREAMIYREPRGTTERVAELIFSIGLLREHPALNECSGVPGRSPSTAGFFGAARCFEKKYQYPNPRFPAAVDDQSL